MDWTQVAAVFAVVAANIGTVIALYLHTDRKMDEHRKDTIQMLMGIRDEMKDFHARLCVIENRRK